jgi:hypothetical protein
LRLEATYDEEGGTEVPRRHSKGRPIYRGEQKRGQHKFDPVPLRPLRAVERLERSVGHSVVQARAAA